MIEKYTFDLVAPKIKKKKLILVKGDTETRAHVILKLLGYLLYYDPRLKVEVKIGTHYKPDLVVEGEGNAPDLWIDCGYVPIKKARNIAQKLRRTKIVLIKKTEREIENFKRLVEKDKSHKFPIEYLAFEPHFVDNIAAALQKKNEGTLYEIMEDTFGFAMNDEVFESKLYRLSGT